MAKKKKQQSEDLDTTSLDPMTNEMMTSEMIEEHVDAACPSKKEYDYEKHPKFSKFKGEK